MGDPIANEPFKELLHSVAPEMDERLEALFCICAPVFEIDHNDQSILFEADSTTNHIRIGMRCTVRLHALALAAGVVQGAFATQILSQMNAQERRNLLAPFGVLMEWAVKHEVEQRFEKLYQYTPDLRSIFPGAELELPVEILSSLNRSQRTFGERFFRIASAFILLHELAHLHYGHRYCQGYPSIEQEKEADQYAADWLLDSISGKTSNRRARRVNLLLGISVALLWFTILDVYLGPQPSRTHPPAYQRLFQVIGRCVSPDDETEANVIWDFIGRMLFGHMSIMGFDFDPAVFQQGDLKQTVSNLIDMISKAKGRRIKLNPSGLW